MNGQHERFRILVTKWVEGAADAQEAAELETHLATCTECRFAVDAERRSKEAMIREAKVFYDGYDAGRLEAHLKQELSSGARWAFGLGALGLLSLSLEMWWFVRPPASQPSASSDLLPITGAFLITCGITLRRRAKMAAIARAAQVAWRGYRDLERTRLEIDARDHERIGRWGVVASLVLPPAILLASFIQHLRLKRAFPEAVAEFDFWHTVVQVSFLPGVLLLVSLSSLWRARRLRETQKRDGMEGAPETR